MTRKGTMWALLTLGVALSTVVIAGSSFAETGVIKIGLVQPLTGPSAVTGRGVLEGAQLAVDLVNKAGGIKGAKLEIIARDDASDPTTGVTAFKELVAKEKVCAVIDSIHSSVVMASLSTADQTGTPLMGCNWRTKCSQIGNKWYFRTTGDDALAATCLVTFAVNELKWKNIAILHENDEFGTGGMEDCRRALAAYGLKPSVVEGYVRDDKDFTGQITRILRAKPDGVIVWGLYVEAALIAKQLRAMGYDDPILTPNVIMHEDYLNIAGPAGNYSICPTTWAFASKRPAVVKFLKDFKEFHGREATTDTVSRGYDAVMLLAEAMKRAKGFDLADPGSAKSKAALRDALAQLEGVNLIGGTYTYKGTTGDGLSSLELVILLDGQQILLSDVYKADPKVRAKVLEGYK